MTKYRIQHWFLFFISRHGVVVALDEDDDLLQPVYQEPYNNPNMQRGALVLQEKSNATSNATSEDPIEHIEDKEPLHLVRKGRKIESPKLCCSYSWWCYFFVRMPFYAEAQKAWKIMAILSTLCLFILKWLHKKRVRKSQPLFFVPGINLESAVF